MDAKTILENYLVLQAQMPALAVLLALVIKSTLVFALCFLVDAALRRQSATRRHLLWAVGFLTAAVLPLFTGIMPPMAIELAGFPAYRIETGTALSLPGWTVWCTTLYATGLALLLGRHLLSLLALWRLSSQAVPCTDPRATQTLRALLDDELSDVRVSIRVHAMQAGPLSWGLLNPCILLPTAHTQWSADTLEHVLRHELAHIARLDWVSLLASHYVAALHWFNPLVWIARSRLARLAEQACDDLVVTQTRDGHSYASNLVVAARDTLRHGEMPRLAQGMAASFLGMRIRAILDLGRDRRLTSSEQVVTSLLVAFLLAAPLAAVTLVPQRQWPVEMPAVQPVSVRLIDYSPARSGDLPAPAPKPVLRLSHNLPDLETMYVTASPVPAAGVALELPSVSVAHARPERAALLLYKRFPEYPREARGRGVEGHTTVEFDIDARGYVSDATVIDSSPPQVFDDSALDAVRDFRYDPPTLDGVPVGVRKLRTRFVFTLEPDPG